jgi:hypothetical protein
MNHSGHYRAGKLYDKDKQTLISNFKYAIIGKKLKDRATDIQGVGALQSTVTIEIISRPRLFQREMYVQLDDGELYMIESTYEFPLNDWNSKSKYFVQAEVKR